MMKHRQKNTIKPCNSNEVFQSLRTNKTFGCHHLKKEPIMVSSMRWKPKSMSKASSAAAKMSKATLMDRSSCRHVSESDIVKDRLWFHGTKQWIYLLFIAGCCLVLTELYQTLSDGQSERASSFSKACSLRCSYFHSFVSTTQLVLEYNICWVRQLM